MRLPVLSTIWLKLIGAGGGEALRRIETGC